jgi:hypothetical protein
VLDENGIVVANCESFFILIFVMMKFIIDGEKPGDK